MKKEIITSLLLLLKRIEFSGEQKYDSGSFTMRCPICLHSEYRDEGDPAHEPDCELAKAIEGLEAELRTHDFSELKTALAFLLPESKTVRLRQDYTDYQGNSYRAGQTGVVVMAAEGEPNQIIDFDGYEVEIPIELLETI
jgi:hypothetical protein